MLCKRNVRAVYVSIQCSERVLCCQWRNRNGRGTNEHHLFGKHNDLAKWGWCGNANDEWDRLEKVSHYYLDTGMTSYCRFGAPRNPCRIQLLLSKPTRSPHPQFFLCPLNHADERILLNYGNQRPIGRWNARSEEIGYYDWMPFWFGFGWDGCDYDRDLAIIYTVSKAHVLQSV